MKKIAIIIIIILAAAAAYLWKSGLAPQNGTPAPSPALSAIEDNMVRLSVPKPNDTVKSPLRIEGVARGNWFFEASFPAEIIDANGKRLAMVPIQATREWMTTEFVPFTADIHFDTPTAETGMLILHKDNASGLPEHDDKREIPIKFNLDGPKQTIKLYYYNPSKDKDPSGNLLCSKQGLEAIERSVLVSKTPVQDAIKLLLLGMLTAEERAKGIETEFPLPRFELRSASLVNNSLTLTFSDPENKTSGGACRAAVLWHQIEETSKQFSAVKSVKFLPEELFQP